MADDKNHIKILDKKISDLSDALAHLGQGTTLKDLLKIIRFPGYTTPAEFAFSIAMVDAMQVQVNALEKAGQDLLAAGRLVVQGKNVS
ncbi:hypothetical protein [Janthinobacterium agaricidamnosum]|uniref:Uncharacterized protein n=1 Tax=Janthinobacterium agaricidamnosum NBRC 102515 = DSM 9628 TaxID=1349767 RepID=W0V1Z0_9BURK|nr:hypothetical protein [Janthinobacterium agaricidamnosum]CDG81292.1 hypothetical protein GJA_633 [Janthinobacterium agaricidamnosum NBRC 102515 = DSM 9628]